MSDYHDQPLRVSAKCASCGTQNELTVSKSLDHKAVACSRCGSELGTLRDLVATAERETIGNRQS